MTPPAVEALDLVKRFGETSPSTTSASRCRRAPCWDCSDRTAPARPPPSACSPPCRRLPAAPPGGRHADLGRGHHGGHGAALDPGLPPSFTGLTSPAEKVRRPRTS